MRPWERITKEDLEKNNKVKLETKEDFLNLYQGLKTASIECADGGDLKGSDEIDNEVIAIEMILENEYGITEF